MLAFECNWPENSLATLVRIPAGTRRRDRETTATAMPAGKEPGEREAAEAERKLVATQMVTSIMWTGTKFALMERAAVRRRCVLLYSIKTVTSSRLHVVSQT